jgi:hypothetical protein
MYKLCCILNVGRHISPPDLTQDHYKKSLIMIMYLLWVEVYEYCFDKQLV